MIFQRIRSGTDVNDDDFDAIYTRRLKRISGTHFTPIEVAKTAAGFLAPKQGTQVLDVGSGAGKFCMIGAACTNGFFTGVEQRLYLCQFADLLSRRHRLTNTKFIHTNVVQVEFRQFDAVYFFNAFYENIVQTCAIDSSVRLDKSLYAVYTQYVREQLDVMPFGTRLATYFSYRDEIPEAYRLRTTAFDGKLKLWVKTA